MCYNESINILNFDIYSKRITFFYNNNDKISSYFGLILTITYILVSMVLFIFYFIITIERKEMRVYDSTIYSKETPSLEVNSSLIYFAFGIEDIYTSFRFVDETIYYPQILYIDRVKKPDGEFYTAYKEELSYELCDEQNFGESYKQFFFKGELNNSYCLSKFNLTLAGGYKYNKMSYIRIKILPCVNSTQNKNHCKPREIIDKYISGAYFSLLIKDIGLNPTNYSYPVTPTIQDLYTTIDKKIFRDFILYFGLTEIQSDIGLFNENIQKEKYLKYRKNFQTFYFRDQAEYEKGKEICVLQIRLDDNIDVQKRTYKKMPEVFSNIGGYMQLISTIFTLLSILVNKLGPEIKILNGIFNFNVKENKMIMKIKSLKDFNLSNSTNNLIINKSINKCEKKDSKKKINNNLNRKSFIEIDKNESIIPITIINNKHEETNKVEINNRNKSPIENIRYSLSIDKINKDKSLKNRSYKRSSAQYRIALIDKDENKEFSSPIKFNLFDYYCLKNFTNKKREIELFDIGSSLYRKRMDVINIFTLLLLTEKKLLNKEKEDFILMK